MTIGARSAINDVLLIVAAWSVLILTMLMLQAFGLQFGFDLWPVGEFRTWLEFLQDGPGFDAAKLFWALDHRNALSPWWYIAARPLIDTFSAAPLILHLAAALFVGVAAYLLFADLSQSRCFGLSVGILSALFLPNFYRDEVIWNFIGALGCTLVSIWLFLQFSNDRSKVGNLAASYIVWFVAISTYTIQAGVMGAVFFVSLRKRLSVTSWPNAVLGASGDALPYVALLAIYVLIWITTSPSFVPSAYLQLQFSFSAFAKSVAFGVWNDHYQLFWSWLIAGGPRLMTIVFVIIAIAMLTLLYPLRRGDYARPTWQSLAFALLIGVCVAGPTVLLESGSDIWIPGTRWPMIMQLWSPFIFCLMVFAALSAVPHRFWWPLWKGIIACAAAFVILLVLGFNRMQVMHVEQERAFFSELKAVMTRERLAGLRFPRQYLIRLADPAPFLPLAVIANAYAHTLLGRDVTFRVVNTLPEISEGSTSLVWKNRRLSNPVDQTSGETADSPIVQ